MIKLPFWHLHASNAALLPLLVALLLQSELLFMKLSTFHYIKFVSSRLKTLMITKEDVVEEIK